MKRFVLVIGVVGLLVGFFFPTGFIVTRCLPSDYADYAANYVKGLNLFRWLLMGGAVVLIVARRHVARVFQADQSGKADSSNPITRREACSIGLITVVGAALCLIGYRQSFTFDEVFLVNAIITQNPIKMFVHPSGSAHVLNSLPANLLVHVLGPSEAICRLPAWVASVCMPVALWAFTRRVFSSRIALLSAAIVCISPIHIWYAQEAKGNAWLMFLVPVSWWLLSCLAGQWRSQFALGYWLSLFLISLSHLSGIMFILATIPVFLLPAGWRPCGLTRWDGLRMVTLHLLAAWAALMFYAPTIPFMLDFSKVAHVNEGTAKLLPLLGELLEQFTIMDQPFYWAVLCGALALCGCYRTKKGILVLFVLPFLIDLAVTIGCQLFSFPRYHMYVFPWLAILIAAAFQIRLAVPFAVALVGYGFAMKDYYHAPKSNLKTLAEVVNQQSNAHIVYVVGGNKKSYPASGLMFYTDHYETDDTIHHRLEGVSDDDVVDVLVIDAMQFETAYAPFAAFVKERGSWVKTFNCLGELDQFRVKKSYHYELKAGDLRHWFDAKAAAESPERQI